jgi:hypothetical protein
MRKVISPVSRQVFLLETSLSSNILSKKTDILCAKTFSISHSEVDEWTGGEC